MQIKSKTLKKIFPLAICWIAVFIGAYLLLVVYFFNWATNAFPLSTSINYLWQYPGDQILLQYTKHDVLPKNYTGVFGDSYATGLGDELFASQHKIRPSYNAIHHVYEQDKAEIISFGMPASSNLKAYIEDPLSQIYYLERTTGERFPFPSQIVLYFYEGNDVDDNYAEARDRLNAHGFDQEKISDYDYFSKEIVKKILDSNPLVMSANKHAINDLKRPYLYLAATAKFILSGAAQAKIYKPISPESYQAGSINKILLSGKSIGAPNLLQGPAMSLTHNQIDISMTILDQSIRYTKEYFHGIPITVLYIPSAATIYQFTSPQIHLWDIARVAGDNHILAPAASTRPRSNELCNKVMDIANKHGLSFHDARAIFVATGKTSLLHGPVDWWHFNLEGQRLLAEELSQVISSQQWKDTHIQKSCLNLK